VLRPLYVLCISHPSITQLISLPLDSGAVETATAAIGVFVLAMVLHPEVQKEAQAEFERVIGNNRLPTLSEYVPLPKASQVLPIHYCPAAAAEICRTSKLFSRK
jgi:cytochrome P450